MVNKWWVSKDNSHVTRLLFSQVKLTCEKLILKLIRMIHLLKQLSR